MSEIEDPRVKALADTVANPRMHVYRHLAMWEAWTELAKAGRNPPLYTRWKREALDNLSPRLVLP